jgi:integral membrane protein (TIGR01906 family)
MDSLRGRLAALVVGIAAALVVVALAILLFLNPVWVGFEQGRAQAAAWTGFAQDDLHLVTNAVLHDLVIGPPDFAVELNGSPVLNEREREHMRDVRGVFAGFYGVAIGAAAVLAAAILLTRGREARMRLWRRLSRSGTAIVVVTIVGGGLGVLFFDAAFEAFHETFFPPGSFLFDPRTDRLVQLFPDQFWSETTVAVGAAIIVLGLLLRILAGRRAGAAAGPTP